MMATQHKPQNTPVPHNKHTNHTTHMHHALVHPHHTQIPPPLVWCPCISSSHESTTPPSGHPCHQWWCLWPCPPTQPQHPTHTSSACGPPPCAACCDAASHTGNVWWVFGSVVLMPWLHPMLLTHTPFHWLCAQLGVCACQPHALLPLQQTHNMPLLLNNHHTTTSHWCCNHTTCCPNTHNTTTPPIIHQLAIVSPCPPPSHATACHTAALQQHTCLAICSCPHTPPGLCHGFTTHNTTQHHRHVHLWVCVVHCGWSPHTFFLCWLHHTTNTVCWLINVPRPHQLHHNTHSLVWCTMPCNHTTHMVVVVVCGAVVGVLVGWHNLHLCLSCPPCGVLHLFLHTTTLSLHPHTLCHPHNNNNHCTVWCHLGNNHQPTNHANQPHSWRVVCGGVCCT